MMSLALNNWAQIYNINHIQIFKTLESAQWPQMFYTPFNIIQVISRWYDHKEPENINNILAKYYKIFYGTNVNCGEHKFILKGMTV